MDVRVKLNPMPAARVPTRTEILTGLPQGSIKTLLDVLSSRHPELAPVFQEAPDRELQIYVNNDEVPPADTRRYMLRDGDTVSLFLQEDAK